MEVRQYIGETIDSNSWLMIENQEGLLIDATDNHTLFETVSSLSALTIILTHSHFDHIIGLNRIRKIQPEANVISTRLCSEHIGNRFRNMSSTANAYLEFYRQGIKKGVHIEPFTCLPANTVFEEEMDMEWNNHQIMLRAFYGHADDCLIATLDEQSVFTGDTLLAIPTITRLPGGSTKRFTQEDIPRLFRMKAKTAYPGHGSAMDFQEIRKNLEYQIGQDIKK